MLRLKNPEHPEELKIVTQGHLPLPLGYGREL